MKETQVKKSMYDMIDVHQSKMKIHLNGCEAAFGLNLSYAKW
jgi:hypothetical protein